MRKHVQFRLAELLMAIFVVGVCCGLARYQLTIGLAFALAASAIAIVWRRVPLWFNLAVIFGSASMILIGLSLAQSTAHAATIRELGYTEAQLLFLTGSGLAVLGTPILFLSTIIYGFCVLVYLAEGERGLCRAFGIRWSEGVGTGKGQGRSSVPPV